MQGRLKLNLCAVLIFTAAGGCTQPRAEPVATPAAIAGSPELECHREHLTGSLIATQVCTTRAQREATQTNTRATRDALDRVLAPSCPGGPGCGS